MACASVVAQAKAEVNDQAEVVFGVGEGEGDACAEFGVDVKLIEANEVDGCAELKERIAVTTACLGLSRDGGCKERELERKDISDIESDLDTTEGSDEVGLGSIFASESRGSESEDIKAVRGRHEETFSDV